MANGITSLLIGMAVGTIVIIVLIKYPGQATPSNADVQSNSEPKLTTNSNPLKTDGQTKIQFNEDKVLRKLNGLRSTLGMTEDELRKAVRDTNEELRTGISPKSSTNSLIKDGIHVLDNSIFIILVISLVVCLDYEYNGICSRTFRYMFPKEAKTLGFSDNSDFL